ncbi:MAG: flavodoxin family protein [Bacteroidales bacterium]|nr:flavodoxin family protein [Bacteroidales bacterium]
MKQALIIYQSKTGTTKKYGFAIRDYLQSLNIEAKAIPVQNYTLEEIENADYVFLGCWTSGLFIILQHPDKIWSEFAQKLPDLSNKKVVLFTTYKLLTGSMFRNMEKQISNKIKRIELTFKAKNTVLSEKDKKELQNLIS